MKKNFIFQLFLVFIFSAIIIIFGFEIYNKAEQKVFFEFQKNQLLLSKETAVAIKDFFEDLQEALILTSEKFRGIPNSESEFLDKTKSIFNLQSKKFGLLFLEDRDGILRFIYPKKLSQAIGKNYSFRPYFQECKNDLKPSISNFLISGGEQYQNVENRYPSLSVAVPIKSDKNQFLGVLGVDVYLHTIINNFIKPIYLEKDNQIFLIDNDQKIIASDEPLFLGQKIEAVFSIKKVNSKNLTEGSFFYNLKNSQVLFTASYFKIRVGSNIWTVIISTPYQNIKKLVFPIYLRISALSFSLLIIFFIISFFLYRNFQKIQSLKLEAISKELEIGYRIQKEALPKKIPVISGYDLHAFTVPAEKVSGDFYDFIKIKEMLHIVIADVSGKGIPAALYMMMSKTLLNLEIRKNFDLEKVLRSFNNDLIKLIDTEANHILMYLTAIYGILNPNTNSFTYVRAGHVSPLWYKKQENKVFELANVKGTLLGLFEDIEIEKVEINLNQGDLLLLYTDGLTDASNQKEERFNIERVITIIEKYYDLTLSELNKRLAKEVAKFSNNRFNDDITLILIRKN
ncbi:MAG: SpoIIE family protein phosphatase [Candidatus Margulisiibacteriota bacterium]|jgi:serine phosphatase RsbU (regulator of sigma subunit)